MPLTVEYIQNMRDKNGRFIKLELSNGRTLCIECHKITDTYGYKTRKLLSNENIGA